MAVIVALWPDEETAASLVLPEREDAEPVEDLHVTLVFLGEPEDLDRDEVSATLESVAAEWTSVSGVFNGIARFAPNPEGLQPVVATFDAPGLSGLREAIREALGVLDGDHGFCPHLTLAFLPEGEEENPPIPMVEVTFDRITLAWGDPSDLTHFPLTGTAITACACEEESKIPEGGDMSKTQAGLLEELFEEPEPVEVPTEGTPMESPSVDGEAKPIAEATGEGTWEALIFTEDEWTDDGRMALPNAWSFRDPPITFMWNRGAGGHTDADTGGAITEFWRDGNKLMARGVYVADESGQECRRLIAEGILNSVSIDSSTKDVIYEEDDNGELLMTIVSGVILGFTVTPMTAQGTTWIRNTDLEPVVEAPEAVAASASVLPAEWFEDPKFTELTPLTVTDDGRVFGHVAPKNECHIGSPNECLTVPLSVSDYAYFLTGEVMTDEGPVCVGQVVMNANHASLGLKAPKAVDHYAHTGAAVADVSAGQDEFGPWVSGALRASCREEDRKVLQASALSGDWRKIKGNLEMVAVLAVNTPGFPIPRVRALVASGKTVAVTGLTAGLRDEVADADCAVMQMAMRDLDSRALSDLDNRVLAE